MKKIEKREIKKVKREIEIETEHAINVNIPRDPYKLILIPWRPKTELVSLLNNHISINQW